MTKICSLIYLTYKSSKILNYKYKLNVLLYLVIIQIQFNLLQARDGTSAELDEMRKLMHESLKDFAEVKKLAAMEVGMNQAVSDVR